MPRLRAVVRTGYRAAASAVCSAEPWVRRRPSSWPLSTSASRPVYSWSSLRPPQAATDAEADLEVLLGREESFLFPQREVLPYESSEPHLEIGGLRVEAVEALLGGRARLMVTTLRALQERAPIPAGLAELRITLRTGAGNGVPTTGARPRSQGLRARALGGRGRGSTRYAAGLLDIFSFGTVEPFRVEFWGDEIVSLRFFDILDQRSKASTDEVHILPVDFHRERDDDVLVFAVALGASSRRLAAPTLRRGGLVGRAPPYVEARLPSPRRARGRR